MSISEQADPTPEQQIEDAFSKWDQQAVSTKSRCQRWDLLQTIFPPLAALLLSIQVVSFPHGSPVSKALIFIELAVLFIALLMALRRADIAGVCWVPYRLKAEVLRREQYLLEARVGAYLNCGSTAEISAAVHARLSILNSEEDNPRDFVPLTDPVNEPWRHQLEDLRLRAREGYPADEEFMSMLPELFESYYHDRVLGQKSWYQNRTHKHAATDNVVGTLGSITLVAALVFAAIHLTTMYFGAPGSTDGGWIVIAAIALPPISAAFSEVRALMQGRQLSRSYAQYEQDIARIETRFAELMGDIQCGEDHQPSEALAFRFKRLVLEAEELFAAEMRTWYVLMAPAD